jgi:hypothetical protein
VKALQWAVKKSARVSQKHEKKQPRGKSRLRDLKRLAACRRRSLFGGATNFEFFAGDDPVGE